MANLKDLFADKRASAVDECVTLIDAEVKDKSGFSGMAIKAGYAVVNGLKPTFVRDSVDHMLDEFATALDPIFQEAKASGTSISTHFDNNKSRVADALLSLTDAKAKRSKHATVVKTYERLRGNAKQNVEVAVPRLGKLVEKFDR